MKIRYAAALSGLSLLIAGLFTLMLTSDGMRMAGDVPTGLTWIDENAALWSLGIWLWLLAVFGWMALLITLAWSYLPGFRVSSMLQSGLMIIAAVLAIVALVTWMVVAPTAVSLGQVEAVTALVHPFIMGMFGAAFFMGGAVSVWIAVDLAQIETLSYAWVSPAMIAGALALPSPFLLPMPWLLVIAGSVWVGWCAFLFTRSELPNAFAEME